MPSHLNDAARSIAIALALSLAAAGARASDTNEAQAAAEAGLPKSAICASCHGPVGISPVPTYPNLAGQNTLYIEYALRAYRAGERGGAQAGMMYTVSQALTDTDITDLANYYASLSPVGVRPGH